MSHYHILSQKDNKRLIKVVFHIAVPPASTNEAGVLYTEVVKKCEDLNSILPGFATDFPVEYQDMQDGKVIERQKTILFSSDALSPAQKLDEIINGNASWEGYNTFKTNLLNDLAVVWEWYGKNGDIT
jgi:hypothetical protein